MSLQRGWGQVGGELSAVSDHVQVRQRQMNYCEDGGARLGWTTDSSVAGLAWLNEDDFGCYCLPGTLGDGEDIAAGRPRKGGRSCRKISAQHGSHSIDSRPLILHNHKYKKLHHDHLIAMATHKMAEANNVPAKGREDRKAR